MRLPYIPTIENSALLFSFIKRAIGIVIIANMPILNKYYKCEDQRLAERMEKEFGVNKK